MAAVVLDNRGGIGDSGWGPMLVFSFLFHVGLALTLLLTPGSLPNHRPLQGDVYEVSLVELPPREVTKSTPKNVSKNDVSSGTSAPATSGKPVKEDTTARRIPAPAKPQKPVAIAKRTLEKRAAPEPKTPVRTSPAELIEQAVSKIERKVKKEDQSRSRVDRAISRIEEKVEKQGGPAQGRGGSAVMGIPMRLYRLEVEALIKSHWAYPVALEGSKDLEAKVIVKAKANGAVIKTRLVTSSGEGIFDQSVLKAVERSDPLPPFPETYRKSYEEFEINFNLKELNNF